MGFRGLLLCVGVACVAEAGCFDPALPEIACGAEFQCPPDLACDMSTNVCRSEGSATADATAFDGARADAELPPVDASGVDAGFTLLEQLTVPADGAVVTSKTVLATGAMYRLRASGTLISGGPGDNLGDAEYADFSDPPTSVDDLNTGGNVDNGIAIDDLISDLNKTPDWGPFEPSHVYEIDFVGAGSTIQAMFHDGDFTNNSGSLMLEIFVRGI